MIEEKDILSAFDGVKRVPAPIDLYDKILTRLKDDVPTSWRYMSAAAAIVLLVANLSIISMSSKRSKIDHSRIENHNPFSITNDLYYE
jgi:hypothetical protein